MSNQRKVCMIEQQEPKFIQKFKEKVGYHETKTDIQDKFSKSEDALDIIDKKKRTLENVNSDDEEFQPQIVVLKAGDLSAEDVANQKKIESLPVSTKAMPGNDRIVFKKPNKRKTEELNDDSSMKKKTNVSSVDSKTKSAPIKKPNLLSFSMDDDI